MPTLFEDWQRMLAPKWLRDGMGDFWLRAMGQQKDRIEQYIRDFVLSRFPDFAAVDALRLLLAERSLEPPFGDDIYANLPAWRSKAKSAFQRWAFGGTHYGVLRELRSSLVGSIVGTGGGTILHAAAELFIYDAIDALVNEQTDDGNDLDGFIRFAQAGTGPLVLRFGTTRWNCFVVLILVNTAHAWHGGIPDDASDEAEQCRRIIQRWRAGHAECRSIIVQDIGTDPGWPVLYGICDGTGDGNGPVKGGYNYGQTGGPGSSTTLWTPPVQ